jgi:hypothetical protein
VVASASAELTLQQIGGAGAVPPVVWVGLGLGIPEGTDCSTTTSVNTQAGSTAQVSSVVNPGYCARGTTSAILPRRPRSPWASRIDEPVVGGRLRLGRGGGSAAFQAGQFRVQIVAPAGSADVINCSVTLDHP